MPAVALRNEPDYRVIYMKEVDFQQKMNDVYLAKQTEKGAPYLDEILEELLEVEALIFAETLKENPIKNEEVEELIDRLIKYEDIEAAHTLLSYADINFIELFQRDVYYYLMDHQMSFFIRERLYQDRRDALPKNQAIVEVW